MRPPLRPTPAASVCLISLADGGSSNGTGFVVQRDGADAWVMTCSHVIGLSEVSHIFVAGRPVTEVVSAASIGLDLALLKVPGLNAPVLAIDGLSFSDQLLSYYGFSKLYLEEYMRTRVDVRLARTLDLQRSGAMQSYLAYEIGAIPDALVQPGHSGAPIVMDGVAVAVVSHRLGQGERGLAIALAAALRDWPEAAHLVGGEQDPDAPPTAVTTTLPPKGPLAPPTGVSLTKFPPLPAPADIDPEDDNVGRFVSSGANGLVLRGQLKSVAGRRSFFVFDLIVEALPQQPFDVDAVRFVLHSSFNPRTYIVRQRRDGATEVRLEDITSYGVFTAGAQVRRKSGAFTLLSYNLADLAGLPKEFLSR